MSLILLKPTYLFKPITTINGLGIALRIEPSTLINLAAQANTLYRAVKPKPGSTRKTFDAKGSLKKVHRHIKERLFAKVHFPDYLQGSLPGKDYFTNADRHKGKQIIICEDVKGFFPSVKAAAVYDIWNCFFRFSPEVSALLTQLTTKDGALPQGAITSSYLANLVFWRVEPLLHAKLAADGIDYSRYVDDMGASSATHLTNEQQSKVIASIYGMLRSQGLTAGRTKHETYSASKPMIATKLIVNRKPSLSKQKRSAVRAAVFQTERAAENAMTPEAVAMLGKASQRVGQLGRFHPAKAKPLKARLSVLRDQLPDDSTSRITFPKSGPSCLEASDTDTPPWE